MRVGFYVDGYNLYYGGRGLMGGRGKPGWRWLDLRKLAQDVVRRRSGWLNASVERVVLCTARISSAAGNPSSAQDQDVYLRALRAAGSVDVVEYGYYRRKVAKGVLATDGAQGRPNVTVAAWPVKVLDAGDRPVNDARFLVSVAQWEEKGSDVNVASHSWTCSIAGWTRS